MRLWSIHPSYLDAKGLVALWRESLLAQSVLLGKTKGYKNHPQLFRFKNTKNPLGAIADYLKEVYNEAMERGYHFDGTKIIEETLNGQIQVTSGQLEYEFNHLLNKLQKRDSERYQTLRQERPIKINPLFTEVTGEIEKWERPSF